MNLTHWDPYRDVRSWQDRLNRALGSAAPSRADREEELSLGTWLPPVDIVEEKDKIVLTAELPGFKENEIDIENEGNVLTIKGERKMEAETEGRSYHRIERAYGQFVRSFTLPNNVDRENIKARFKDGILEIQLPKREEARPKQIKIDSEEGERKGKETINVQAR